jgi:hypothetical protein
VTECQSDLARSYNNLGILQRDTGDTEGARESYESALAIFQKLAEREPTVPAHREGVERAEAALEIMASLPATNSELPSEK